MSLTELNVSSSTVAATSTRRSVAAVCAAGALLREQFSYRVVSWRAGFVCGLTAVAIGFTNPIAMSLTEILLGVMAFCWLLAGGYRRKIQAITCNPVALSALALLAVLSISVLYGNAPWNETLRALAKYRNLLYLVLFITIFRTARMREAGLWAFAVAMTLTLIFSFLTAAGVPLWESRYTIKPDDAVVFRNHIVHGLCMGLFAYLMAHRFAEQPRRRWYFGVLALLAMWNVLFMVAGRTGYLVLAAMIPLFCLQHFRLRTVAYVTAVLVAVGIVGYFHSSILTERVGRAYTDVAAYLDYRLGNGPLQPEGWHYPVTYTSCGIRLDWYRNGLRLMARKPILGVGVGSVRHEMQFLTEKNGKRSAPPANNLHSEYVMTAAQTGLIGLLAMGILLVNYWRTGRQLSSRMRHLAEGTLLTLMVAGLANTILTERTEGVLFAFCSGLAFAEFSERAIREKESLPEEEKSDDDVSLPQQDMSEESLARAA